MTMSTANIAALHTNKAYQAIPMRTAPRTHRIFERPVETPASMECRYPICSSEHRTTAYLQLLSHRSLCIYSLNAAGIECHVPYDELVTDCTEDVKKLEDLIKSAKGAGRIVTKESLSSTHKQWSRIVGRVLRHPMSSLLSRAVLLAFSWWSPVSCESVDADTTSTFLSLLHFTGEEASVSSTIKDIGFTSSAKNSLL